MENSFMADLSSLDLVLPFACSFLCESRAHRERVEHDCQGHSKEDFDTGRRRLLWLAYNSSLERQRW